MATCACAVIAIFCALADTTLFAGPGPAVARPAQTLESEIGKILSAGGLRAGDASVVVIDDKGKTLAAVQADKSMKPASNLKILTTLAGLEFLGPDYLYETLLTATSAPKAGVVSGDVTLWGTGDPNISGRFYKDDPQHLLRDWAAKLKKAGLQKIDGDFIVDDSFFDDERFLPGWKRAQEGRWYSAEISSLSLNDNCIDVHIDPTTPGQRARVRIVPESDAIQIDGAPVTVGRGKTSITIRRKTGTNQITIRGQINSKSARWMDHVAIHDPAMFFAKAVVAAFRREGITLTGRVRRPEQNERRFPVPVPAVAGGDREGASIKPASGPDEEGAGPGSGAAPARGKPAGKVLLVRHRSKLALDLPVINKRSQNLHAEILLKTLGRTISDDGSVAGGAKALQKFVTSLGIDASHLAIHDGSGLSHGNRVSARMLARALAAARSKPYAKTFYDSLPVAGVDGTLDDRFRSHRDLIGRVRAKTGYILGVSGLTGYVERDGRVWSFSILFNRLPGGNAVMKRVQERVVAAIDRRI